MPDKADAYQIAATGVAADITPLANGAFLALQLVWLSLLTERPSPGCLTEFPPIGVFANRRAVLSQFARPFSLTMWRLEFGSQTN